MKATLMMHLNQSILPLYQTNKHKYLGKGLDFRTDLAVGYTINISKYILYPLEGSSYIKLPKELDHPKKGSIKIQNVSDR